MYKCYIDSGYNNKTKSNGYASYKVYQDGAVIKWEKHYNLPNIKTSNQGEYQVLIDLLDWFYNSGQESQPIEIFSDSMLVVNQINGKWKVGSDSIYSFWNKASILLLNICHYTNVEIKWNRRDVNLKELGH